MRVEGQVSSVLRCAYFLYIISPVSVDVSSLQGILVFCSNVVFSCFTIKWNFSCYVLTLDFKGQKTLVEVD